MIIRSPTNRCMLLKTKRVLEFEILPDHAEQIEARRLHPSRVPVVVVSGLPWPHYKIHKHNRVRFTRLRTCELWVGSSFQSCSRNSYTCRASRTRTHGPQQRTSCEYIGCEFCGCNFIVQYYWYGNVAKSMETMRRLHVHHSCLIFCRWLQRGGGA